MPLLQPMPSITIDRVKLAEFGTAWKNNGRSIGRNPPYSSKNLGKLFDNAVGTALSTLLGNIPVVQLPENNRRLIPPEADCVEVGDVRVIGGVRSQNYDVGYRPDGIRFAYDTKTLNDTKSIGKNWQNMVNDLATEATNVHSRFPYAVVAFLVAIPEPSATASQRRPIIETLERLARRSLVDDPLYMAEAISLVLWNPDDGTIDLSIPGPNSPIRFDNISSQIELAYTSRYKGLPPHTS